MLYLAKGEKWVLFLSGNEYWCVYHVTVNDNGLDVPGMSYTAINERSKEYTATNAIAYCEEHFGPLKVKHKRCEWC